MWHLYSNQMEIKQKLQTELNNVKVEKVTLETKIKESNRQDAVTKLTTAIQWANDNQLPRPILYFRISLLYSGKRIYYGFFVSRRWISCPYLFNLIALGKPLII